MRNINASRDKRRSMPAGLKSFVQLNRPCEPQFRGRARNFAFGIDKANVAWVKK
jgi:hypothetical protein